MREKIKWCGNPVWVCVLDNVLCVFSLKFLSIYEWILSVMRVWFIIQLNRALSEHLSIVKFWLNLLEWIFGVNEAKSAHFIDVNKRIFPIIEYKWNETLETFMFDSGDETVFW